MSIKYTYYFLFMMTLTYLFWSCEAVPDCEQEGSYTLIKVKLFDKDSLTAESVKYDSIKAVGSDSLFFSSADSLNIYSLELNSSLNSSTFLFYTGTQTDSLSTSFDSSISIPFEECGPKIDITNIVIIKSTFDSTVVINDFANINFTENIEIYQ